MTYERVTLVLTEHEMQELRRLAQRELRRPRDQAAYIIRRVLNGEQQSTNEKSAVTVSQTNGALIGINP